MTLAQLVGGRRSSPQYAAMQLGNTVFGGGALGPEQSRLFRDIRQNAGLVYSIGSQYRRSERALAVHDQLRLVAVESRPDRAT